MRHDQLLVPLEWDRIGRVRGAATGGGASSGGASGGGASGGGASGGGASGGASGGGTSGGGASGASDGASDATSGAAGNLLGQIELQNPVVTMLHDRCVYSGGHWIGGAESEDHCLRGV